MKMKEAENLIADHERYKNRPKGYRVHFERIVSTKFLDTEYVPDKDEPMIVTEAEAWKLAERLAEATKGRCFNFYVVDERFFPVDDYEKRRIMNR